MTEAAGFASHARFVLEDDVHAGCPVSVLLLRLEIGRRVSPSQGSAREIAARKRSILRFDWEPFRPKPKRVRRRFPFEPGLAAQLVREA